MFSKSFVIACLCVAILTVPAVSREWTDRAGNKLKGDFVRLRGAFVQIKVNNIQVRNVPYVNLSDEDQEYVREQLAEKGQEDLLEGLVGGGNNQGGDNAQGGGQVGGDGPGGNAGGSDLGVPGSGNVGGNNNGYPGGGPDDGGYGGPPGGGLSGTAGPGAGAPTGPGRTGGFDPGSGYPGGGYPGGGGEGYPGAGGTGGVPGGVPGGFGPNGPGGFGPRGPGAGGFGPPGGIGSGGSGRFGPTGPDASSGFDTNPYGTGGNAPGFGPGDSAGYPGDSAGYPGDSAGYPGAGGFDPGLQNELNAAGSSEIARPRFSGGLNNGPSLPQLSEGQVDLSAGYGGGVPAYDSGYEDNELTEEEAQEAAAIVGTTILIIGFVCFGSVLLMVAGIVGFVLFLSKQSRPKPAYY